MRTDTRLCVGISGIFVLLGFCGIAQAQTPASSLPNLSLLIGERIEVTDTDDSVFTGQLIRASEASIVLGVDGKPTELSPRRIRAISRWEKDSVTNGILIGLGLGLLIPVAIGSAIDTGEPGGATAILLLPGVGIGLAAGSIVDAMHQRKIQIFPAASARVAVAPLLAGGRKGVALSLSF